MFVIKDTARRYWRTGAVSGSDTDTKQELYNDDSGIGSFTGGWGARFNSGHALVGQEIRSIKVKMRCASPNTVNMTARLYGSTKATLRATSTAVSSSGLTSSYVDKTFVFPSGSRGVVQAGDHIMIVSDTAVASSGGWNCQIKSGAGTNTHFTTWQDQTNAFTEQTTRELWYDPIVSGTFTPATWTMTPTFEDDFSSDAWVDQDTEQQVTGGSLAYDPKRDNTNDASSYDLQIALGSGLNASDSAWVLQYVQNHTSVYTSGNGNRLWFGISDKPSSTAQNGTHQFIGLYQNFDFTSKYGAIGVDGGALPQSNTATVVPATGTDYYTRITRVSSTSMRVQIWTGGYDQTVFYDETLTIASTLVDLRYIWIGNFMSSAGGNSITGTIDNLEFYNGVTSIN